MKKIKLQLTKIWQYFYCPHRWIEIGCQIYNVIGKDGKKNGEVTLTVYKCDICKKESLKPSDRVYLKT